MMNNDTELNNLILQLKEEEFYIILEDRPPKYLFGTNNYGEICNTLNTADGDPYDVIVPGYPKLVRGTKYKVKTIEGIIIMPHRNHKMIIDVHCNLQRNTLKHIRDEIFTYRRLYNRICKKRGHVMFFTQ